ncbi:hypothetical protein JHK85_007397 [Glycine max]|uniref:TF-B3 domain-containing protein n=1 Tax=Glycine max TaxID=3847 RepID=A0A0R0KHK9_SOYBN|nr:hypothetical protein JHK85_007397 [Glycine max]KAG5071975.1 hypothetical protein JHK86_007186 [Glycine max]KAH1069497.1 hypothetical protein GYH30_006916 [Glycine max]
MSELTNEEHEQCCEMAKIMLNVTVASETILNTVNAKDQIYDEVNRSFVVRWKDVLDRFWHLLDKDGNFHTVLYNQNLDRPTIVAGWTTLRDFYHMTEDHQVSLTHYGKSVFFLTVFKSSSHPKSFSRWYSLYHQVPNSVTFNVFFTQHKITCSSLKAVGCPKQLPYEGHLNPIFFLFVFCTSYYIMLILKCKFVFGNELSRLQQEVLDVIVGVQETNAFTKFELM